MIKLLFFAHLADAAESSSAELEYNAEQSVQNYLRQLVDKQPALQKELLEDESVLVSVNQKLATRETVLSDGDEVGLLPPFSGG